MKTKPTLEESRAGGDIESLLQSHHYKSMGVGFADFLDNQTRCDQLNLECDNIVKLILLEFAIKDERIRDLLTALEASEKRGAEFKDHLIANVETFEAVIDDLGKPEQDWTVGNNAICRIAIDYTKQALADAEE